MFWGPSAKFHCIIYAMFLITEIHGDFTEPLTMNTLMRYKICSSALSSLIFNICSGNIKISDESPEGVPKIRGKRAAIYAARERMKRQVAYECCEHACTISQLIQYCPETW
ncbi:hypothetical protein O3G_MSEX002170 [Manduca sexta]|uniref:Insulin-like domain-containing protein n=1 Tax=Manduca sexta TaxID=7130 RepID=A0A921YN80_MANSE|nr:hypothetical protein O3G_MSEX002170 [Manduca sexta]